MAQFSTSPSFVNRLERGGRGHFEEPNVDGNVERWSSFRPSKHTLNFYNHHFVSAAGLLCEKKTSPSKKTIDDQNIRLKV